MEVLAGNEELERLQALRDARILDSRPDDRYDKFTRLAASILKSPIALISLLDDRRQWFKSRVGLDVEQTDRKHAFCDHVVRSKQAMIVNDASEDVRFSSNPLVIGEPHIRFYAGAPLNVAGGHCFGTLCIIDTVPRTIDPQQQRALADLAEAVADHIDLDRTRYGRQAELEQLRIAERIASLGTWRMDVPSGNVRWSPEVYRIHGVEPVGDTASLTKALSRYDLDDRHAFEAALLAARQKGTDFDLYARMNHADGKGRVLHCIGTCQLGDQGTPESVFGIVRDVTQLRELELRLAHAERMASIGSLAAGVAHDLNNPLSYIKANADFIEEELVEMLADQPQSAEAGMLRKLTSRIREVQLGTRRIQSTVRGLKSFSSETEHDPEPLQLKSVLEAAVQLASHELRHRAKLECKYDEGTPLVIADESQLIQAAVNLMINAAQAIPDGHSDENFVRLRCGATDDGDIARAYFTVEDTGRGMAANELRDAFTPFYSARSSASGSGLGLSIAHGIISAHGGTLTATSVLNEGSCFRAELPASIETTLPSDDLAPPKSFTTRRLNILVVDDDLLVAQSLARLLHNHKVRIEDEAGVALAELLAGASYDAIVCDLMMPNVSGRDLYTTLLEKRPDMAERVIFITGGAFTDAGKEFIATTPVPIINKPVTRAKLLEVISDLIEVVDSDDSNTGGSAPGGADSSGSDSDGADPDGASTNGPSTE